VVAVGRAGADHTRAIRAHPDEYEERAAAFFDDTLL
jgi:hypothetical protein